MRHTKGGLFPRLPFILLLILAGGLLSCSGMSPHEVRKDLLQGDLSGLEKSLSSQKDEKWDFSTALNLGRIYQLDGRWRDSIGAYERAVAILEEYERRAIVSVRGVAGGVGAFTLARGSSGYYGKGYERTLLHTMNALNYMMLGDFSGASVEMRRMEIRQELWLEEKENRLREELETRQKEASRSESKDGGLLEYSADRLPSGYSMKGILEDPAMRSFMSGYQEPFSYSLSGIVCRIAGDREYARVSMNRASSLNIQARSMFTKAWGSGEEPPAVKQGGMEVVLIVLGGFAPALKMEQIRIVTGLGGYLLFDLPAYMPALAFEPPRVHVGNRDLELYGLLRTEILAYRELRDDMNYELAAAMSRVATRAAMAVGAQVLSRSNEKTRGVAKIVDFLLSASLDLISGLDASSMHNWETLPASGYLGMLNLPSASELAIFVNGRRYGLDLPAAARGVILLVTQTGKDKVRVDHVTY